MNKFGLLVMGIFLAACQPTTPAGPPTVTVSTLADSGAGSLRETLSSAEAGSVVSLKNLTGTLTLASELVVSKNLTLEGSGVVISGDGKTRVLNVAAGSSVTLKSVKLTGGKSLAATSSGLGARAAVAGQGGVIFNAGTLVIQAGTEISGGEASLGGGIYNAGTLTLEGGVIRGNKAVGTAVGQGRGGGVFNDKGATFTISSGTIQSNASEINSGGVETAGTLTMSGGSVESNTTAISGGGISIVYGGSFTFTGGTIKNNSSTRDATVIGDNFGGGGVNNNGTFKMQGGTVSGNKNKYGAGVVNFDQGNGATFEFSGGTIENNSALGIGNGGGIATFGGNFVMTNGVVQNNTTSKEGAGIVIGGNAEISGGEIKSNTALSGAGLRIYKNGKLTLKGGTISSNTATDSGGGITLGGTMTVSGGIVQGNTATNSGGGIRLYASAIFTMTDGSIQQNNAKDGAGIQFDGPFNTDPGAMVSIQGGTIQGNTASMTGGGLGGGGKLEVSAGTIENNIASKFGGGINLFGTAAFTMSGGVIRGNAATTESGGGVNQFGTSTFTMTNGVIENNRAVGVAFNGGGVHLAGAGPTFQFKGGTIRTNQARNIGGGIATSQATVVMSGGTLSGNTASNGGGISVDGDASKKGTFTLTAGSITGNTASVNGGGVFTTVNGTFANNGGAVTGNTPTDIFPTP